MSDATNLQKYDKTSACDFVHTFSGKELHFLNPQPDEIRLVDIINNLSNNCRYCGNVNKFYSVAEHSVLIAKKTLELTGCKEQAWYGLMHDASEAYICDIPRPLKPYLTGYYEIETIISNAIYEKYGVTPISDIVKYLDCHIVRDEAEMLFNDFPSWASTYNKVDIELKLLSPNEAKTAFKAMVIMLGKVHLLDI